MSRVKPADERRRIVLVVGSLRNTQQAGSTGMGAESLSPAVTDHEVYRPASSTTTPTSPTTRTCITSDFERDPHNEVERRRKQRISRNIKTLAETLTPPCHCGKTTRAEILEMVVKQIKELQQRNSDLKTKLKDLPKHTNAEELSQQAAALIEENLRLRALLLAAVSYGNSQPQNPVSTREPQQTEGENNCGRTVEVEKQQPLYHGEEEEVVPPLTNKDVECEKGVQQRHISPTDSGSNSEGGGSGSSEGEGERENEEKAVRGEAVDNTNSTTDGEKGSVEQPWPISSLLSDPSRGGVRDNLAFNLPLLSPTYIAEHCSTAACEQQFFNPQTSTLPPNVTGSLAEVGRNDSTICSTHRTPLSVTHSTVTQSTINGVSTQPRMTDSVMSSVHTLQTQTTEVVGSLSTAAISGVTLPPHCHSALSHNNSPTTIVQPWVGSSNSSRMTENSAVPCSVTSQQLFSSGSRAVQLETEQRSSHRRSREPGFSQHRKVSSLSNPRRPRHTPRVSHPAQLRVRPNREHVCSFQYPDASQLHYNPNINVSSSLEAFSPNHTPPLTSSRGHTFCSGSPSAHHSTLPSCPMYTTNQSARALWQPSSFPAPSLDPYYHHSSLPQHHHHNPLPLSSLCLPTQLHASHANNNPSHPINHPHHAHNIHVHTHTYNGLPPPTHPHHHPTPPPSFAPHPHQHPPSHHNTVWRPYSDRQRTSTRFNLSDILSPVITSPTLGPPTAVSPHQSPSSRIPSFFVDHLLDDL